MVSNYGQTLIVVPTRNRAELARNAIRSVLDQREADVRVMVSDNSTSEAELEKLAAYCKDLKDQRLRYVRPPQPLPMPQHWEWAMGQALADESVSHVTYLTDRMVFKSNALNALLRLVEKHPDRVISYNNDIVSDYALPIRLQQASWTGRLFALNTTDMLAASAKVCGWLFFSCTPRMLNCIAPRNVLEGIRARFGNLFLSIAPDLCFAYRCLELLDSILYYDKALLISYAHSRSNGASYVRGLVNKDYQDFITSLDGKKLNYAAPIPEFMTGTNAVMHEYCFVKEESQSPKFPEIDRKKYLDSIAAEIPCLEDPRLKKEMQSLLEKHRLETANAPNEKFYPKVHELAAKLSHLSPRWLVSLERPRSLWTLLENRFGVEPRGFNYKIREFQTVEAALCYGEQHPRAKNWGASLVETEIRGRPVPQA